MATPAKTNITPYPSSILSVGERLAVRMILASLFKFYAAGLGKIVEGHADYSETDCLNIMRQNVIECIAKTEIEACNLGEGVDIEATEEAIRECAQAYLNAVFAMLKVETHAPLAN
jgi:hypothetical protein